MFPGKEVTPLVFTTIGRREDLDGMNGYIRESAERFRVPALLFSLPEWTAADLGKRLAEGGFLGVKAYLSMAPDYLPAEEIRIFDFIPPHQLQVLHERKLILMLHVPRPARLKDPVNLAQILEIERTWPGIRVIIAHVGRAYCPEDVGNAFEVLGETKRMIFDISVNTNAWVFERLIRAAGPGRILFGSDLPIARMRMRRICENGIYVNLVPPGLYGDISGDRNMREVSNEEGERLTFFMYEEIAAFRKAAEACGLTRADVEAVFNGNARRLFEEIGQPAAKPQLQMFFPEERLASVPPPSLPSGYSLRTYRDGDAEGYISVMRSAGFETWDHVGAVLAACLPDGIFFAIEDSTGKIVGTACANHHPCGLHPSGGELGWVAVDPGHRGRRIGQAVTTAVLRRFRDAGYRRIYLLTDDFRLPAIKMYLELGFVPFLFAQGMEQRWREVARQLNLKGEQVPRVS